MKVRRIVLAVVMVALLAAGHPAAWGQGGPATPRHPGWEQLKALAGDWDGTYLGPDLRGRITYRMVSNGSAMMLTVNPESPQEMITVFHPDGDELIASHYCSAGNQPRMKAQAVTEPGVLRFAFLDVTNVKGAEGHMRELVIRVLSPDHHTQEWTFHQGEQSHTGKFDVRRLK